MRTWLSLLVSEPVVVFMILLNATVMVVLGYIPHNTSTHVLLDSIDYGCIVYFVLEAALKIGLQRKEYFRSEWNRFDFVVVMLSSPALFAPVADLETFGGILILRLGRLFRLFRLLRFIPDREHIFAGVGRALRASIGVFLALFLLNVILALGATFLFRDVAPELFGNPFSSLYTMFKVFTLEDWFAVPDLLAERSGNEWMATLARAYFVVSVLVGGILGLSMANAVFVDEMTLDNTDALEAKTEVLEGKIDALREEVASLRGLLERDRDSG